MRRLLRAKSKHIYLLSILYALFGILLLSLNQETLMSVSFYAGIVIMLLGIGLVVTYFKKKTNVNIIVFVTGIGLLFLGFAFFGFAEPILKYLPYGASVLFILHAADEFYEAWMLHRRGYGHWGIIIGVAIITMLFSILIIFQIVKTISTLLMMNGVGLIIQSIVNLILENILANNRY